MPNVVGRKHDLREGASARAREGGRERCRVAS
jgi:hypothetical protein